MLHLQSVMLALALATTMLVGVGCGGSSKTTSTTRAATTTTTSQTAPAQTANAVFNRKDITIQSGKPLTRAAWLAKGDAICTRVNSKLSSTIVKSSQDFARVLPQAAIYDHIEATELSKLVPPTARRADWKHIIAGLQTFSELSAKAAEYARTNNIGQGVPVFATANRIQQRFTAIAKRDGFKECSIP